MFGAFARRMKVWYWRHPSDKLLLLFHDGEISNQGRVRVQGHLKQCPRCRKRAAQIAQDWISLTQLSTAATADPLFKEDELIPKIQASIHAWSAANLSASQQREMKSFASAKERRQVASVLETYLGKRAVSALFHGEETKSASDFEKLDQAKSILRILLGHKGSTAVEKKLHRIMANTPNSRGGF